MTANKNMRYFSGRTWAKYDPFRGGSFLFEGWLISSAAGDAGQHRFQG